MRRQAGFLRGALLGLAAFAAVSGLAAEGDRNLTVESNLAARFDRGRKWAVVIGINKYLDPSIPSLRYCVADARRFAETLVKKCGYEEKRVLVLADDQTQDHLIPLGINLRNHVAQWLKHPESGDTAVVFFSGHGFLDAQGQGYLAPKDCEKANLGLTGFRTDDLRNLLTQCKATQKLLILDCCHAGGVRDIDKPGPSSRELGVAFEKAQGLITLASCQKDEVAREWDAKQQGLFTYFLTEGLAGAADFDGNGIIDSDELNRYTFEEVRTTAERELNGVQTPARLIGTDVVGVFALARVPARAKPRSAESNVTTNSIGVKLVLVPAGEFMMGSGESPDALARAFAAYDVRPEYFSDEYPQHRVRITRPFYLGAHEVTVGQFRQFVADAGYRTDAERSGRGGSGYNAADNKFQLKPEYNWRNPGFPQTDEHPVVNVSWNDASAFCEWLTRKEGKTYRLPTEAEWEYACRAGTTTRYSSGDDPETLAQVGNVADAAAKARFPDWKWTIAAGDGYAFTAPVGQFRPNAFGLYDMHGNAWEWSADWYGAEYYATSPTDDPKGPEAGALRVLRGGSWLVRPNNDGSAYRFRYTPFVRVDFTGFRVARTP